MCCSMRRSGSTDIRVASVALVTHGSTLVMSRYHDATVSKHIKNKTTTAGTCWGLIVLKGFEVLGYTARLCQTLRTGRPLAGGLSFHDVSGLCMSSLSHVLPRGTQAQSV